MRLRGEQLEPLGETLLAERLVEFLRAQFPEAHEIDSDELFDGVTVQIGKAIAYGFQTERDIAQYSMAAFLMGECFDTTFDVPRAILGSSAIAFDEKARSITAWVERMFLALEQ